MQMKRGHSGAVLTRCEAGVMKVADKGKGLLQQAELCKQLHPITPRIIETYAHSTTEAYSMELLREPLQPQIGDCTDWVVETIEKMRELLAVRAWYHNFAVPVDPTWMISLHNWLQGYDIGPGLRALIPVFFNTRFLSETIHGDPTLSNCLYREPSQLVIADPIPAAGKIPNMATVDLGKMLQSALGWETELFDWQYDSEIAVRAVMRYLDPSSQARTWFWAAVHCLRVIPYATNRRTENWALVKARFALGQARSYECYMRSISMVHSSTAEKLS